ncbi:MAG: hypothetical protein U1E46_15840 [Hyphomicrobiales bacterium]
MARSSERSPEGSKTSRVTTKHDIIRQWVEARGGRPATVAGTARNGAPGVLRIDFPGYGDSGKLEEISWDEFFEKFDAAGLAFLYQDETESGDTSRFSKFVRRNGR